MEIRQAWNLLRRWWWLILLCVAGAAGLSYLNSKQMTPTYQATTRLLINQVESPGLTGYNDLLTSERLATTYAQLLQSRPVLEETARQLNVPSVPAPTVKVTRDTALLDVTITDTDPVRAAVIANQLAQVFIRRSHDLQGGSSTSVRQRVDQEVDQGRQRVADATDRLNQAQASAGATPDSAEVQRLQRELSQAQDAYGALVVTQQRIAQAEAQSNSSIAIAEPARAAGVPVGPHTRQDMIVAGFIGLVLAAGIALLYERLDDRIRDPEEIRRRFALVPLAVINRVKGDQGRLLTATQRPAGDEFAEALRLLRTNLDFVTMGESRVICVSSAMPQEGKSTIAANLAIVEAQAGKRVVLIDADLRNPNVHRLFDLSGGQGLSTFLAQTPPRAEPEVANGPLGIRILAAGTIPPNPSELLNSHRLAELLDVLRATADLVIIDSSPILPIADTLILQPHIDGIVLVVDVGRTGTRTLERMLASLQQASAHVLGVVLNKDTRHIGAYGYGYGYGYGNAYGRRYGYGKPGGGQGGEGTAVPAPPVETREAD